LHVSEDFFARMSELKPWSLKKHGPPNRVRYRRLRAKSPVICAHMKRKRWLARISYQSALRSRGDAQSQQRLDEKGGTRSLTQDGVR